MSPKRPTKTTKQRGYGAKHAALRKSWAPKVAMGNVICPRCGFAILPEAAWDLGHSDVDRSEWTGPEHARCNRRAGQRKGAAARRQGRPTDVERWRQIARDPRYQDDPSAKIFHGPPWSSWSSSEEPTMRWSQAWFPWRDELR